MQNPEVKIKVITTMLLCAIFSLSSHGQVEMSKHVQLQWELPRSQVNIQGNPELNLYFAGARYRAHISKLPLFETALTDRQILSFHLENIQYQPLTPLEEILVSNLVGSALPSVTLHTRSYKKKPEIFLSLVPLRFDPINEKWEKMVAFTIQYTPETNKTRPSAQRTMSQSNSVLSGGSWYKFGVTTSGIFQIDANQLADAGVDINSIDPKKIKIFGNGGGMLPQANDVTRFQDLTENAIVVEGENDGTFDSNDVILFYGQGPDHYRFDESEQTFKYEKNIYSDTTYYFLTIGSSAGLRIGNADNLGTSFPVINEYDYYEAFEEDKFNLISSGRKWYGDGFKSSGKDFVFNLEGIASNTSASIEVSTLSFTSFDDNATFDISVDASPVGQQSFSGVTSYIYGLKGDDQVSKFDFNTNILDADNQVTVNLQFNPSANIESTGYLDYLFLTAKRKLSLFGDQTLFRSLNSLEDASSTFEIGDFPDQATIWDVSDPLRPKAQLFDYDAGNRKAMFGTGTDQLKEFIAFNGNYLSPTYHGTVKNQNLHGSEVTDMVIISHPDFMSEAQRLATFRETHDGLSVQVVTIEEVYNEFSSGAQDVTAIRDFMKHLYDQGTGDKLKYLLLFGDCSFDYKNRETINTNKVPVYQSRNSLWPTRTYSSDDYYGFLDDDEGEWVENSSGDHLLDIGVGRLPVNTPEEAKIIVDKIIHYSTNPSTLGNWRNEIHLIADDSDGDGFRHFLDAEALSRLVEENHAQFNVNKLYLDAFQQEVTPNGEVAPVFRELIEQAVNKGTLIVNYTGHGNEEKLTEETVIDLELVKNLENYDQMALFVTATCEFGRYDDPIRRSGAEELILNPNGGAIAMLTTSRPVFSDSNLELNLAFYNAVFQRENGNYLRLGDIMIYTKNNSLEGFRNRNFSLLGDPSMRLNYPEKNIVIDHINGIPITDKIDTLTALNKVTIGGKVVDENATVISSYNGVLEAVVYDKKSSNETLPSEGRTFSFEIQDNIIYKGKVSIEDGGFQMEFVVPKNISYLSDNGKISMYARSDQGLTDANGANIDVVIGGSSKNVPVDNKPPTVELYMEDTSFVSGGFTNSNTLFLAHLTDESGINISNSGLGQNITAILDGEKTFNLNDFYETDIDSYQSGWVAFPLNDMSEGEHVIVFKAWDTFNNSVESSIKFKVKENNEIVFTSLYNYPNPFSQNTTFHIEHNRAGDDLYLTIEIFSVKGELVRKIDYLYENSPRTINDIEWNGRGFADKILENGMYIYKVYLASSEDGAKNQQYQKLVIIN
ncbi:type IX secretion system sortase PorU [Fulvivirgaceae bacterium BMA12]|uniref:Type IX secretion system sortase PorU n=1 Tax=Agaribacillus aureus TaxID=3051825 RepID=A0ABT8LDC0_9BACT|nr:type IX secretion system sortase PorU [Fulvivirgaceae bacterium BMA12]